MPNTQLIGPFSQCLTLDGIAKNGPISNCQLEIIPGAGIEVTDGIITDVGSFEAMQKSFKGKKSDIHYIEGDHVALPGLIDAHTHLCFAGSRASDYQLRNEGSTYLDIAEKGGGIWDTVSKTRKATDLELLKGTLVRLESQIRNGITTTEIKSGYGLNAEHELRMLKVIKEAKKQSPCEIIATCLAAHIIPKEFSEENAYLDYILNEILEVVYTDELAKRFDIFIEKGAFTYQNALPFLQKVKSRGFDITIHADQFTVGGSKAAIVCEAASADHLEASTEKEIEALGKSDVVAVALPGASIGLGVPFAPVRKLLDANCAVAIASDWNPGSAPQGDLLVQASILGTFEKLTTAEVLSGMTFRAAAALRLKNKGKITSGFAADFISFPCDDYREILYHQGMLKPNMVWKAGKLIAQNSIVLDSKF